MMARGVISAINIRAEELGIRTGDSVAEAAEKLNGANASSKPFPGVEEARSKIRLEGMSTDIILVDSASLVTQTDRGRIIITGSHGGLIGGDPARALKAQAALAVFNDAGGGCDNAGLTRLPALDERAMAAVTVSHRSARIGNAESALEKGIISHVNSTAAAAGLASGQRLSDAVTSFPAG